MPITGSPDLSLNTLSHFLDRFVYKNAKKLASSKTLDGEDVKGKGGSAMQPAASALEGVKLVKGELGSKNDLRVNDPAFWKGRKERDVAVDEMFYYKYFTEKSERERKMAERRRICIPLSSRETLLLFWLETGRTSFSFA